MTKFQGHFYAYLKESPSEIIWERKNVEVVVGGWLLAWVMASQSLSVNASGGSPILVPNYPIWGLAIGNATQDALDQVISSDNDRKLMTTLVNEFYRKNSSYIYFLDPAAYVNGQNITVPNLTPYLEIQTVFNSNTDVILQTAPTITEMGLVGGTTQTYSDPLNPANQTALTLGGGPVNQPGGGILLDYVNPTPFQVPMGHDFVISVILDFTHLSILLTSI